MTKATKRVYTMTALDVIGILKKEFGITHTDTATYVNGRKVGVMTDLTIVLEEYIQPEQEPVRIAAID